jgi:hypothetical protein
MNECMNWEERKRVEKRITFNVRFNLNLKKNLHTPHTHPHIIVHNFNTLKRLEFCIDS